jgi:hypothetical protein
MTLEKSKYDEEGDQMLLLISSWRLDDDLQVLNTLYSQGQSLNDGDSSATLIDGCH